MEREIITLQFGNKSNHIGLAYWDLLQQTAKQAPLPLYTQVSLKLNSPKANDLIKPRVLTYDLKQNLGCLVKEDIIQEHINTSKRNIFGMQNFGQPQRQQDTFEQSLDIIRGTIDKKDVWTDHIAFDLDARSILTADIVQHGEKADERWKTGSAYFEQDV